MLEVMNDDDQRDALYLRFRFNLEEFSRYCWPEKFNLPFNDFHASLFSRSSEPGWRYRVTTIRDVVAGPRGYGKTALTCFAQVVHAVVYDLEACIVILSAGLKLALAHVMALKYAFEDRAAPLWEIYGPIKTEGPLSQLLVSPAGLRSCAILPGSFGADVRGWKHPTRGIRPGLVLVDDGEKKFRVRNPDQRQVWWDFLTKDVMKLGPREGGMRLQVRGTVLHTDSMLANALKHPGFRAEKWAAILSWPDRQDLWATCGRMWADLADLDRAHNAREFYDANREAMDQGVEVLDPDVEGIYQLYTQIWGEGLAAFLQEKQNDPRDPNSSVFDVERFHRCRVVGDSIHTADGRIVPLKDIRRRFLRWDPAMGEAGGDFAALVVGLRDQYGYTYIVDAWVKVAKTSEQLVAMWALCERWNIHRVGLESNGFQRLVADTFPREREERKEKGEYWRVEIEASPSTTNKEERIASLEPDCHNGWVQFAEGIPMYAMEQFSDFPSANHDDFPDAVEGCQKGLGGCPVRMAG